MSATGQGLSLITGINHSSLAPVTIPAAQALTFTHGLDRQAFSVIVTSGSAANYGQVLVTSDNVVVSQPADGGTGRFDTIVISNNDASPVTVFVSCRWEESTRELDLVQSSDSRIVIA